jgi:hypothetical protein
MKHLLLSGFLLGSTCGLANAQTCAFPDKAWKCCGVTAVGGCPEHTKCDDREGWKDRKDWALREGQ